MRTIITKNSSDGGFHIGRSVDDERKNKFTTIFYSDGYRLDDFLNSLEDGDEVLLVLEKLSKEEILKYKVVKAL